MTGSFTDHSQTSQFMVASLALFSFGQRELYTQEPSSQQGAKESKQDPIDKVEADEVLRPLLDHIVKGQEFDWSPEMEQALAEVVKDRKLFSYRMEAMFDWRATESLNNDQTVRFYSTIHSFVMSQRLSGQADIDYPVPLFRKLSKILKHDIENEKLPLEARGHASIVLPRLTGAGLTTEAVLLANWVHEKFVENLAIMTSLKEGGKRHQSRTHVKFCGTLLYSLGAFGRDATAHLPWLQELLTEQVHPRIEKSALSALFSIVRSEDKKSRDRVAELFVSRKYKSKENAKMASRFAEMLRNFDERESKEKKR